MVCFHGKEKLLRIVDYKECPNVNISALKYDYYL
jgi:hypothetical protein